VNTSRDIRKKLTLAQAKQSELAADLLELEEEKRIATEVLSLAKEARAVARKAATIVQDELASKLSSIVTKCIHTVFGPGTDMAVEFVERRGVSECDLYVTVDGAKRSILRGDGGGLADAVSLGLQISFILLSDVDRVYIADEPARHLDHGAQARFADVLKFLRDEFGFTFILVTHSDAISEAADKLFMLKKVGDKTEVKIVR